MSQFATEKDKIVKIPKVFMNFRQIFDRLGGLECSKGSQQPGQHILSSMLSGKINAVFFKKMSEIDIQKDKKLKFEFLSSYR